MTPEEFYSANIASIGPMLRVEQQRRDAAKMQLLTEDDIEIAVLEMMARVEMGDPLESYKFPEGQPNAVDLESQRRRKDKSAQIRQPSPTPETKQVNGVHGNSFKFEIVACENGHILNMGGNKTFIVQNINDLTEIFNTLFFKKVKEEEPKQIEPKPVKKEKVK